MIIAEGFLIPRQIRYTGALPIGLLDDRRVLADAGIIAGPGEKGGDRIDRFPELIAFCIIGKRLCHQKGASVQILLLLQKMYPTIPHHGLKILFQPGIALIISSGHILGVILILPGHGGLHDALRPADLFQLLADHIRHIVIYYSPVIQKFGAYGKERHISRGGALPFRVFQLVILSDAVGQHPVAKLRHPVHHISPLHILQQIGKIQMVGVHQGIHRHEVGNHGIPVGLIDLIEFAPGPIGHHEAVLSQLRPYLIPQVELIRVVDIAEVLLYGIWFHRGHYHAHWLRGRQIDQPGSLVQHQLARCPHGIGAVCRRAGICSLVSALGQLHLFYSLCRLAAVRRIRPTGPQQAHNQQARDCRFSSKHFHNITSCSSSAVILIIVETYPRPTGKSFLSMTATFLR